MANSMAVIPDNEIIVEGGGLVPSTQGASSGDVLTVGQNGPEWAAPGGGGGGGVPDVANPLYIDSDDAVALRYGSGLTLEEGEATENDTLAVALSGTGGLYYDEMESNGLAVQLDPDGGIENYLDDGEQVGLRVKVDGTSIDINADGELEALGGGGIDTFLDGIETTPDKKTIGVQCGNTLQVTGRQYGAMLPLISYSNTDTARMWNPWNYAYENKIVIQSYNGFRGYNPTWYPAQGNYNIYIRQKTATWSYSSNPYYIWDGNERRYAGNHYYYLSADVPTGTGKMFDESIFDVVGDWSSITTPITVWFLGFTDSEGNRSTSIMTTSATTTQLSARKGDYSIEVKTKTNGGLSVDYYNGLYVTNPLPSSLGTAGQVLTVNSGATGVEWTNPSSGASYTAGAGIAIDSNNQISAKIDTSTLESHAVDILSTSDATGTYFTLSQLPGVTDASSIAKLVLSRFNGMGSVTISGTAEQEGMKVIMEIGRDANFTKSAFSIPLLMDSSNNYVTIGSGNATGAIFYLVYPDDSGRTFDNVFSFSDYTFADVFSGDNLYVRLRALDLNTYEQVGGPLTVTVGNMTNWAYALASDACGSQIAVKNPLPSTLGNAGQVLTVNSGRTGVQWATPSGLLPAFDPIADEGKVLQIDNGIPTWVLP